MPWKERPANGATIENRLDAVRHHRRDGRLWPGDDLQRFIRYGSTEPENQIEHLFRRSPVGLGRAFIRRIDVFQAARLSRPAKPGLGVWLAGRRSVPADSGFLFRSENTSLVSSGR